MTFNDFIAECNTYIAEDEYWLLAKLLFITKIEFLDRALENQIVSHELKDLILSEIESREPY